MKIVRAVVASLATAVLLAGCAAAATEDSTLPAAEEVIVSNEFDQYVEQGRPVNNTDEQAVATCNRAPGSGVIMSFDDSGTPAQVTAILDVLRDLNWRAAFFPTGKWAVDNWDLITLIQQEGHIVGSHTWTHQDLGELIASGNESEFYGEIHPLRDFATTDPMLLRPPYGSGMHDPGIAERLTERNYQICGWTADTNDWRGGTAEEMLERVMEGYEFSPEPLAPDGVVLAHLNGAHTTEFIRMLAEEIDERGWGREPLNQ